MKFLFLILKDLRRNKLRTAVTSLSVMVLMLVVTMIWTVIYFIANFREDV
jgi:hypothetical protein